MTVDAWYEIMDDGDLAALPIVRVIGECRAKSQPEQAVWLSFDAHTYVNCLQWRFDIFTVIGKIRVTQYLSIHLAIVRISVNSDPFKTIEINYQFWAWKYNFRLNFFTLAVEKRTNRSTLGPSICINDIRQWGDSHMFYF